MNASISTRCRCHGDRSAPLQVLGILAPGHEPLVLETLEHAWELIEAGQRVQVMKSDRQKGGVLQFGTELVTSADGSIGALLGASPGASTAVPIMLNLLSRCFPAKMSEWEPRIKELIPSYGKKLDENPQLADEIMGHTAQVLGIK